MTAPRTPMATDIAEVTELADAILDGRPTITAQALAAALNLDYSRVKRAGREGVLPIVRVSPRRLVVTRSGLIRYLLRQNGLDASLDEPSPIEAKK